MSYILDALRRADAERSRGAVPGLHAQNVPVDGEPGARNFYPLIWAGGVACVLVVAAVVVLLFGPWRNVQSPDARVALAPAPELAPPPRDDAPALPAQGEIVPAQPGSLDPGARPIEPPLSRVRPVPVPVPVPVPDARPLPSDAPVHANARNQFADRAAAGQVATLEPRAAARAPAAPAQPPVEHYGSPVEAAPAAVRSNVITNINDLPPSLRSQLPRLAVGGAIYSDTPSARMVILNGQVWHEGDKPAADTVLEQIRLKSAVLNFRGQRYEVAF